MRHLVPPVFVLCSLCPLAAQRALPLEWIGGGHPDASGVAFTPDGLRVISSSMGDHTLKLWDLADGSCQRTFAGHFGGINGVAVSPDGTRMVSGGEVVFGSGQANALVWDVATATVVLQLNGSANEVFAVAWSPDGRIAAGDQSGRMFVWDAATGALQHTIEGPAGSSVFAVAFSPDGSALAAGFSDGRARTYDIASRALLRTFTGHTFFVDAVAFAPDGQTLATGSFDGTARLWSVATGAALATIEEHTDIVRAVRFAHDGASFFTGSWDGTAKRFAVPGGALLRTFTAPGRVSVNSLALSPDGTVLLTGAIGGAMLAWDVATGEIRERFGHHTATIVDVDVSADGSAVGSTTPGREPKLWNAGTGTERAVLIGHTDIVNAIALNADASLAATGAGQPPPLTIDPTVRIWNGATGALLRILPGHSGGTTAVDFAPDGVTVVSGGRDDAAKVWNAQTGALLRTIGGNFGSVGALAVSPDGTRVAVASGTTRIWRLADGALLHTLTPPGANHPSSVDWSPDGTLVVVGEDAYGDNVRLWDAQTGALLRTFTGDENGFVQSVAFAPDGLSVACGSGYSEQIRRFWVADGSLLAVFDRETGWGPFPNLPLAYAADGHLAYGRSDPTVVLAKCPGRVDTYGAGCAGSGGAVPALGATGCATTGSLLTITAGDALGGAPAILLFGAGAGAQPLLGCTLLVLPVLPVTLPVALSGSGAGNGGFDLPLLLGPGFPALAFTTQLFVLDAGGPAGLSASNGLALAIE